MDTPRRSVAHGQRLLLRRPVGQLRPAGREVALRPRGLRRRAAVFAGRARIGAPRVSHRLRLPAELAWLAIGREAVGRVLHAEGWGGEVAQRVLLTLTEALGNAIEHGSRRGASVEVEVDAFPERLLIRVTDAGRPGEPPPAAGSALPPTDSLRGRGLPIMRALADRFELCPAGTGTEVRLEFARSSSLAAA
jgi:anti-sigma regulatory factor (Ser/Thr protein kinase)